MFKAAELHEAWDLFDQQYATPGESYDVWAVDPGRFPMESDPAWEGESFMIPAGAPPGQVRLAASFVASA